MLQLMLSHQDDFLPVWDAYLAGNAVERASGPSPANTRASTFCGYIRDQRLSLGCNFVAMTMSIAYSVAVYGQSFGHSATATPRSGQRKQSSCISQRYGHT